MPEQDEKTRVLNRLLKDSGFPRSFRKEFKQLEVIDGYLYLKLPMLLPEVKTTQDWDIITRKLLSYPKQTHPCALISGHPCGVFLK